MLFKKSRRKKNIRVLHIAQQEWTKSDTAYARSFFSSETFQHLKAFCDGQLIKLMLAGQANDEYRKGWLDCQRVHAQFANVADEAADSKETVPMQMLDDE